LGVDARGEFGIAQVLQMEPQALDEKQAPDGQNRMVLADFQIQQ